MHASALGKSMLAFAPGELLDDLLAEAPPKHSGHAVGSIGVVGDTDRVLPRGPGRGIYGAVTEAARGVSRELGARRWPAPPIG